MYRSEVEAGLTKVAIMRAEFARAQTRFQNEYDQALTRLIQEGLRNFLSASEIAKLSGLTIKQVRVRMRLAGLDPRLGATALSKQASKTLADNAAALGVDPREIDLMSPLAYLPVGSPINVLMGSAQSDANE